MAWYSTTYNAIKNFLGFAPADTPVGEVKLSTACNEILALTIAREAVGKGITAKQLFDSKDLSLVSCSARIDVMKQVEVKAMAVEILEQHEEATRPHPIYDAVLSVFPKAQISQMDENVWEVRL